MREMLYGRGRYRKRCRFKWPIFVDSSTVRKTRPPDRPNHQQQRLITTTTTAAAVDIFVFFHFCFRFVYSFFLSFFYYYSFISVYFSKSIDLEAVLRTGIIVHLHEYRLIISVFNYWVSAWVLKMNGIIHVWARAHMRDIITSLHACLWTVICNYIMDTHI